MKHKPACVHAGHRIDLPEAGALAGHRKDKCLRLGHLEIFSDSCQYQTSCFAVNSC